MIKKKINTFKTSNEKFLEIINTYNVIIGKPTILFCVCIEQMKRKIDMNYLRKINLKIIGMKNKNNVCMHFRS